MYDFMFYATRKMNKLCCYFILHILVAPSLCNAEEGDWGFAHNNYVIASMNDKWAVIHRSQIMLRDNVSDLFFGFIDIGVGYKFLPGWRLDGVFRRAWIQPGDKWLIEDRPLVNLTWFGSIRQAFISNRSRVEFREYHWDKKDDIRFRNETRLNLPFEILPGGIKPYFEEEFFWAKVSHKFEMNWLTSGIYWNLNNRTTLKLGYRWIYIRTDIDWENRNQLVTGLNFYF